MEDIKSLLSNNKQNEPPQISALKQYAQEKFNTTITVRVSSKHYLIKVPGAALAGKFRIESANITEVCGLDKPLVIHIGY